MEGNIIENLNFDLQRTTSLQLLQAISDNIPEKGENLCKYLLELSLFDGLSKKYTPYTLVMSALSMA